MLSNNALSLYSLAIPSTIFTAIKTVMNVDFNSIYCRNTELYSLD